MLRYVVNVHASVPNMVLLARELDAHRTKAIAGPPFLMHDCYSDDGSGNRFSVPCPAHGLIAADVMAFAVLDSLARGLSVVAPPTQSVNNGYLMLLTPATLHAHYHTLRPHSASLRVHLHICEPPITFQSILQSIDYSIA